MIISKNSPRTVGVLFAKNFVEGKKIQAIKNMCELEAAIDYSGLSGEYTAKIGLYEAKEFFEGVWEVLNPIIENAGKSAVVDGATNEYALYKAFREAGFSMSDAIKAAEVAATVKMPTA